MSLLGITIGSGLILLAAYFTYGRWLVGKLKLPQRHDHPGLPTQ